MQIRIFDPWKACFQNIELALITNILILDRQHNFKKYGYGFIKSGGSRYDYLSVMHYGRTAFGSGKVTIDAKDNRYDYKIGQRSGFSSEYIKQVNAKYQCWRKNWYCLIKHLTELNDKEWKRVVLFFITLESMQHFTKRQKKCEGLCPFRECVVGVFCGI